MSIKIITDSASDLPKEIIEEYNIDVIPLIVSLGDKEFLDGETIDAKTLYDNMREGKVYKTAQASLDTLMTKFEEYAKNGDSCIYIAFSSGLSGTYQTAVLAKEELKEDYPNFDLDIIDTKCASVGFGLVVYKACQMVQEKRDKAYIIEATKFNAEHMEHIFTVDDLEYLYRGGRVSRAAAVIGGLLNIKPILDVEDGKLIPIEKIRGRKKVFNRMIEIMKERGVDLANQTIGINHGDNIEAANEMQKLIEENFDCKDFVVSMIGCAIGSHSGPGTFSVFFLNDIYDK